MRSLSGLRLLGAIAIAAMLAACAAIPPEAPKPVTPQITEDTLRARAKEQLAAGLKLYETGDYDGAQRSLQASLDHGLLGKTDQGMARKHLAFIHCVAGRASQCADEFRRAFEIDQAFALTPAEDGHPIWGPVYRNVRATLIAEREATQGKPKQALAKAEQMLFDGLVKYEAGEFPESLRLLEAAYKEGLKETADQVRALKHAAFCLCLLNRYPACRAEFIKIYDVDPNFDLTPAEAGHPSWTRTFAGAKAQAKRALADKARKRVP
ncbi:MAG TPA: TssQ family T6SS-associated lipoprotein [Usitatibacteraceae bacterium]|nr:TssQ family T6SS-associated lipoprotein [Usitatibacteraceae bacterium]